MGKIFQPQASVKLTNVSVVRLKVGGKRFEVACYKNKVGEYRTNLEKDIDNVLQIHSVFINVSKGQLAPIEDLKQAFKTDDLNVIIERILRKGEIQVGEKERNKQIEMLQKEVVQVIVSKTINPQTKKPYPFQMIEEVLKQIPYVYNPNKNPKQIALELLPKIQEKIPIERVLMKVHIAVPKCKIVFEDFMTVETVEKGTDTIITGSIEPGKYKELVDLVQKETKGAGIVQVLSTDSS